MIYLATKTDRTLLNTMFSEFYASDAVLHAIPQAYHDAALDELFSAASRQRAYILADGETPVGYALLSEKYAHEAGGLELWLEELYLRETARGKGLGSEFFRFLLAAAQKEGIARVRLEVEPENTRAAALYARLGFRPLPYDQMAWTPEEPK